jgi:hypothetical protein
MEGLIQDRRVKRSAVKALFLGSLAVVGTVCLFQSGAIQFGNFGAVLNSAETVSTSDLLQAMSLVQHELEEAEVQKMVANPKKVNEMAQNLKQMRMAVMQDAEKLQLAVKQMQQILDKAHQIVHDPKLPNLLAAYDAGAAPRRMSAAFAQPAMGAPRAPHVAATSRAPAANMAATDDLKDYAKELNPVVGYWDPLNLAEADFWDQGNEATVGFLRHAEIKHGRVAMAAFVGYCVQSNWHFPWKLTDSISYDQIAAAGGPADQWDALPTNAKLQIIIFVGLLELYSESANVLAGEGQAHYMRGGKPGYFPSLKKNIPHPIPLDFWDPLGFTKKMSDEKKAASLRAEVNNGRLAMLGIMAFLSEAKVPGSVPALTSLGLPSYSGEVMAPLSAGDAGLPFVQDMINSGTGVITGNVR